MKSTMQTQQIRAEQPPASRQKAFQRVSVEIKPFVHKNNTVVLLKWKKKGEESHRRSVSVLQRSQISSSASCVISQATRVKLRACFNQQANRQADSTRRTKPREPEDDDRLRRGTRHQRERHAPNVTKRTQTTA